MNTATLLALFAGFFAGTSLILGFGLNILFKQNRKTDAERMLLLNKMFVRDGQAKLFSDSMIDTGKEIEPPEKSAPMVFRSPFQAGLKKAKEQIEIEKKTENGSNLPPQIKEQIVEAAEKAKAT